LPVQPQENPFHELRMNLGVALDGSHCPAQLLTVLTVASVSE